MANNISVTISVRDRVSPAMQRMTTNTRRQESAFARMGATGQRIFSRIGSDMSKLAASGGKLNSISMNPLRQQFVNISKTVQTLNRNTNALTQTVSRLAATYLGVMGAKAAISTSDTIVSAKNRIGDANETGWNSEETQQSLDKIYASANRARTGYADMMSNVGKSMALASGAFNDNIDNAIRFQEVMGKAYAVSGASQAEQASSMYQMIQALSSGVLQGDELRSVREGATAAYQAIEKYAQGIYDSNESLKTMASDGLITSDIVVAAILNAGDKIDARFKKTRMTAGQMWTMFKNDTIKAFEPVSQKINDLINSDSFRKIVAHIESGLQTAAKALIIVFNVLQIGIDAIANHWGIVAPIITFFISLIIASMVIWALKGAWAFISVGVHVAWFIIKIIALCAYYSLLAVHAFMCALAQLAAWAIVVAIVLVVVGVIMLIGYAYSEVAGKAFNAIGAIVGFMLAAWEVIKNIAKFIANIFIAAAEWIVYAFAKKIYDIKSLLATLAIVSVAVAQAMYNGFASAVEGLVNFFLNGVNKIIDGWNALMSVIPDSVKSTLGLGVATNVSFSMERMNLSDTIGSIADWVGEAPTKPDFGRFEYGSVTDAYKNGYDIGTNWYEDKKSNITDKIGSIKDKFTSGIDKVGKLPTDMALKPDDYSGFGADNAANLKDIKDKTKNIDDSVKNLNDNFDYMIELAEREAINRFTTAEIKVEMSNTNNIRENADIDGIINTLSSRLREEMSVVAAGTHY